MPPTTASKKFEYTDNGLTFNDHARVSPTDLILELGIKALDRVDPSKTAVPRDHQHPKSWWEAQVRLYGLKCSKWTIDAMYEVLAKASNAGIEVSEKIKELERKMQREYADGKSMKMEEDDTSFDTQTTNELSESSATHKKATGFESIDRVNRIRDEIQTRSDAVREIQLLKMNAAHRKLLSSPEGPGKDPFGTWQMDCPKITAGWGDNDIYPPHMIWKIHPPTNCGPATGNKSHLWCQFTQLFVEGVMHIQWTSPLTPNRWRNKKFEFVFRGRDTGESDFVCDDDWNKGWIKFTSEHECEGVFEVQFGDEPYAFTGKKTGLKITGKKPYTLQQEYKKLERDYFKHAMW